MKKKYTMIVEATENSELNIRGENEGFNAFEILGFLDFKRQDVLDQINDVMREKAHFKRTIKRGDEIMEIEEVNDDQT